MVRIRQQRAELAGAHEALNMPNAQAEPYIKAKIFYAERNAYLTGITLFLSLYEARGLLGLREGHDEVANDP